MPTVVPEQGESGTGAHSRSKAEQPPWTRAIALACVLVVLLWAAHDLVLEALAMPARIAAPFQFDYEEGNILNTLVRITHGLSPYPDPHGFPNVLNPYGPVAYYLLALPVKFFGLSFAPGRWVIIASVAGICLLLALIMVKLGGSRPAALAFAFLYPTLVAVAQWTWLLRVDFLGLLLSMAGLYVFCRGAAGSPAGSSAAKPSLFVPAALMVAALFVKYTLLAAPAASVAYLLLQRRWREAARFAAIGVALSGAALALASALTGGRILAHLFLTHPDPFSWEHLGEQMWWVVAGNAVLVALAGVLLISGLWRRRLSLPTLWLLFATVGAVTAGKLGSNSNHLLEWCAALCLSAAMGFSVLLRLRPAWLAAAATLAATLWMAAFMLTRERLADPMPEVSGCPQAYAYVRQQAGDRILSENVGALVLAGKTVWVSNPFVYTQLVVRRGWPDTGLQRMVERGDFDLIITDVDYPADPAYMSGGADRFSPAVVKAMGERYHVAATFDCGDASYAMQRR